MEKRHWILVVLIVTFYAVLINSVDCAPLPSSLSGTVGSLASLLAQGDSSASLRGGKVENYPRRSMSLGSPSSSSSLLSSTRGGATSNLGGASLASNSGNGGKLSSGSLGRKSDSKPKMTGFPSSRLGSGSTLGGGSRKQVEMSDETNGGKIKRAHRHGHSGTRHQGSSGRGRTVRMDCKMVPPENLKGLLGPAFNGRYMSVEKPPLFRPVGVDLNSRTDSARAAKPGTKWVLGGTLMGDQPAPSDNDDDDAFAPDVDLETAPAKSSTDDSLTLQGFPVGELRGKSVHISEIRHRSRSQKPTEEPPRLKLKSLSSGMLQGDQPVVSGVILTGYDAISGLPNFAVDNSYQMDLRSETEELTSSNILEDRSSGLTVFLQNDPLEAKKSNDETDLTSEMLNDSEAVHGVDSEMAENEKNEEDVQKDAPSRSKRSKFSGPGATQPWECTSEVVWEDLGEDYYPRYIRRTRCLQRGCYNAFYECREKSFTIKVLRRVSDRCVPVYGVTMKMSRNGVPVMERDRILRYEQEWTFQERALPFCCECAPRFL